MNYTGAWLHPLSPYRRDKDEMPVAIHPQPGGFSYRHWLGLILEDPEKRTTPARVVQAWRAIIGRVGMGNQRVWAFGYDMDNAKARCYYEALMPIVMVEDEDRRQAYEQDIHRMIRVSEQMARQAVSSIKAALFHRPKDRKGDFSYVENRFVQNTEAEFYELLDKLRYGYEQDDTREASLEVMERWLTVLARTGERLFDQLSQTGHFEAVNPARIAKAWSDLRKFNSPTNPKLRKLAGLA